MYLSDKAPEANEIFLSLCQSHEIWTHKHTHTIFAHAYKHHAALNTVSLQLLHHKFAG